MKVAFSILNMPGGGWHWVMRLWTQGPDRPFVVVAAKTPHATANAAWGEAIETYLAAVAPTERTA